MNAQSTHLLRVTVLQTDIIWCDPVANRENIELMISKAPSSDLYLLPEMFDTGFCMDPQTITDSAAQTLEWMKQISQSRQCALAGSIATRDGDAYYNRFYFVEPDKVTFYNKRHLFGYGGESRHYQPGQERVVVPFRGVRFLLQVCYDLRFPVFSRNRGDYDAILYVANWPESRIGVWDTLLRARAMENQCYVLGANRVGEDPSCSYIGDSLIVNPYGEIEAVARVCRQSCASAEIDMTQLEVFRKKFPVGDDRDPFTLELPYAAEPPSL